MILPTIHTNGSSPKSLREEYVAAYHAADTALDVAGKIDFNGRDYYPQGDNAFHEAKVEHHKHLQAMRDAREYFMAIAMHCDGFVKD